MPVFHVGCSLSFTMEDILIAGARSIRSSGNRSGVLTAAVLLVSSRPATTTAASRREALLTIRLPAKDQVIRAAQRDGDGNPEEKILGIRSVGATNYV
jgi:hypothetical protein